MSKTALSVRAGMVGRLELMEAALQYLEGNVPAAIPLKIGTYTIGRGSTCDIQIKAQLDGKFIISRSHAMLQVDEEGCSIKDMGSTNGVFVNDQRINTVALQHGDVIRFAGMSEVPVGSFLTTSNVSVMYTVRLFGKEEAAKKRALMHASSSNVTGIASTGSNQVVSNGSVSSGSGSKRAHMQAEEDQHCTKRTRHSIETSLQVPSSPSRGNSVTVLHELKELKSMHTKELAEMREKFDNLQRALRGSSGEGNKLLVLPSISPPVHAHPPAQEPVSGALMPAAHSLQDTKTHGASVSTLKCTLSCALCRDLLVIPVVLPCSHGYCALCLERSMRSKKHLCPVCCDPPYEGRQTVYYRSEHIENVVWIALEASPNTEEEVLNRLTVTCDLIHVMFITIFIGKEI